MAKVTGQCHCGQITYEAEDPNLSVGYCDCRGCQKATGTLRAPFVHVNRAGFRTTKGDPKAFRAASGDKCDAGGVWHFCSDCGTQLFWKGDRGDEIAIFAGTLDDASLLKQSPQ